MRRLIRLICLCGLSSLAAAQNACLLEGSIDKEKFKECRSLQMPLSTEAYAQQCEAYAEDIRSQGGTAKAKVVAACPRPAQGTCQAPLGVMGATHYYGLDEARLKLQKMRCADEAGVWHKGG